MQSFAGAKTIYPIGGISMQREQCEGGGGRQMILIHSVMNTKLHTTVIQSIRRYMWPNTGC